MESSSCSRRYLIVFSILLALVQVSFGNNAIILDQNLLGNGGFENGDSGWIGISQGSEVASTVSFTGDNSLYFSSKNSKREVLSTSSRVQYTSNTRYAVAASYKNTSSAGNVKLGVKLSGDNFSEVELVCPLELNDTSHWKDMRFIFEVPLSTPPAQRIQLCLIVEEDYPGEVWFDELSLQSVLPGKNQMTNGGFEDGGTGWSLRASVVDNKHELSGDWSVKITGDPNNANNIITNTIQPDMYPGETYLLTCYYLIDTEGNSSTGFRPQVRYTISGTYERYYSDPEQVGNWVKFQVNVPCKDTTDRLSMYFQANKSFVGNVWIDDFEFLRIPANHPEIVSGFNVNRTSLDLIECSWVGDSIEPFKYNLYISTEADFAPDESTLFATLDGDTTSFEYKIPKSRRANKFYFAIAAVDIGGQEGDFAYAESKGAASLQFEIKSTSGKSLNNVKIAVENVDDFYTDSAGKAEFMLLEGIYPYVIRKQGFVRQDNNLIVSDIVPITVELSMIEDAHPPKPVEVSSDDSIPGLTILTWTVPEAAPEDGDLPSYYIIYKSTNSADLKLSGQDQLSDSFKVGELSGSREVGKLFEWLDKNVEGETTYYYVVVAIDLADNPAYSNLVSSSVKIAPAPSVISPKAKKPFLEDVVFEWVAMKGAETYIIEFSSDDSFSEGNISTYIALKSATSYTVDEVLTPGVWYWRMKVVLDTGAESRYSEVETFVVMDVSDDSLPIAYFVTSGLYNPLNGDLEISYVLKEPGKVNISIYTKEGQIVKKLLNWEPKGSGAHYNYWDGKWNGRTILNGLYFIKLEYDNGNQKTSSFYKLFVWKE